MSVGRWFGRRRDPLQAGLSVSHTGSIRSVLWLTQREKTLAIVDLRGPCTVETRVELEKCIHKLGAKDFIAISFCEPSIQPIGQGERKSVQAEIISEVLPLARAARNTANRATLATSTFDLPIGAINSRHNTVIEKPWPSGMTRIQAGGTRLVLCGLPTNHDRSSEVWLADLATALQVDHVIALPASIADWPTESLPTPDELLQRATPFEIDKQCNASWKRLAIRTTAREVDGERLSDALELSRAARPASTVPDRATYRANSPESNAYFAAAELAAAANRADRYLQIGVLKLGNLDYLAIPGAPVEALGRRFLVKQVEGRRSILVTESGGGGGVLTAWALYRDCDYETQAIFQPHSIATGDYIARAAKNLIEDSG